MAQRVASLYAEIGANVEPLKRGLNESKGRLESFKRSIQQTTDPFRQLNSTIGMVTTSLGVLAAAGYAAKTALDWGYEAAQLKRLEASGTQLAASLGSDFEEIRRKAKAASLGTISDSELILATNRSMMLGLTADADKMANLLQVSAHRGRALGVSTAQAFNDIVTGIGRMSPLILDNLGIIIDADRRYQEYAAAHGIAASAIDETTKRQILLNAVLEEGNRQLADAGGLVLDDAAKYEKLNAALKDYQLSLKAALLGGANGANALGDYFGVVARLNQEIAKGNITWARAEAIRLKMEFTSYSAADAERELDQVLSGVTRTSQELATRSAMINGQLGLQATAATQAATALAGLSEAQMKAALGDLGTLTGSPLKAESEAFADQQRQLQQEAANLKYQIAQLQSLSYLTPEQSAELAGLQTGLRQNAAEMRNNAAEHTQATREILFNMMLQRVGQMELDDATRLTAYNMVYQMGQAWGLIDQATMTALQHMDSGLGALAHGNIQAAQHEMSLLKALADSMVGVYPIVFDVQVTGQKGALALASKITGRGGDINEIFAPAPSVETLNPGIYGGGSALGGMDAVAAKEIKKSKTQIWMEAAGALSQIGSIAAEQLRSQTVDPLKKQIEAYEKLIRAGHIDTSLIDQTAEAERRRAEAAERVAKAEEKIAALQKQQQRLQFLESQVRLLDLIKENDLNAGDILGGMKLGAGASMEDVLAATTRAMSELIAKTERKLGIASPLELSGVNVSGGGPGNVVIEVNVENLNDRIDVEYMAQRIADVYRQRYN
jgi:hypothetical protein